MAAWLNEVVVRAALLSALRKEFTMHIICGKVATLQAKYKNTEYDQQSPRECRYLYWRVQWHPAINNKWGDNPGIVGVGRRLSGSSEQGPAMAPPRARITNDRSSGVAVKVKLAGIGTGRRLLGNKPLDAAYNADCAVK